MRPTGPYIFLIILSPVNLFILNQGMNQDVCHYYENPNLIALFKEGEEAPSAVAPRSVFFFGDDDEENRKHIMKNINYDYLDLNKPVRNFKEFAELESDEIGIRGREEQYKEKPIPWKMDDVQSFAGGPKVLPDIVLIPETPGTGVKHKGPRILTDKEKELGRFVVQDVPARVRDMLQQEKLLQVEAQDMGDDEINERYLKEPNYNYPHSVVLNKVVKSPDIPLPGPSLDDYFRHVVVTPNPIAEEYTIEKTPSAEETAHHLQNHLINQMDFVPVQTDFDVDKDYQRLLQVHKYAAIPKRTDVKNLPEGYYSDHHYYDDGAPIGQYAVAPEEHYVPFNPHEPGAQHEYINLPQHEHTAPGGTVLLPQENIHLAEDLKKVLRKLPETHATTVEREDSTIPSEQMDKETLLEPHSQLDTTTPAPLPIGKEDLPSPTRKQKKKTSRRLETVRISAVPSKTGKESNTDEELQKDSTLKLPQTVTPPQTENSAPQQAETLLQKDINEESVKEIETTIPPPSVLQESFPTNIQIGSQVLEKTVPVTTEHQQVLAIPPGPVSESSTVPSVVQKEVECAAEDTECKKKRKRRRRKKNKNENADGNGGPTITNRGAEHLDFVLDSLLSAM